MPGVDVCPPAPRDGWRDDSNRTRVRDTDARAEEVIGPGPVEPGDLGPSPGGDRQTVEQGQDGIPGGNRPRAHPGEGASRSITRVAARWVPSFLAGVR
jgi:hypothetical protein